MFFNNLLSYVTVLKNIITSFYCILSFAKLILKRVVDLLLGDKIYSLNRHFFVLNIKKKNDLWSFFPIKQFFATIKMYVPFAEIFF